MRKVLIALDNHTNYSIISNKGNELAKALDAAIVLLHVFPDTIRTSPDTFSSLYPSLNAMNLETDLKLAKQLEKESEIFLIRVKTELKNEEAEILTAEDDVANAILETAASCKTDIIVLGSHSRRGIDKIFLGNVAQKVLKHTHLPLFIIPVR